MDNQIHLKTMQAKILFKKVRNVLGFGTLQTSVVAALSAAVAITGLALSSAPSVVSAASCTAPANNFGTDTLNVDQPGTSDQIWIRLQTPTTITPNTAGTSPVTMQVHPTTSGTTDTCFTVGGSSTIQANTWTWVHTDISNNPLSVTLPAYTSSANNYTQVELWGTQSGLQVDSILFLTDGCVPTGIGSNCTNNQPLPPTPVLSGSIINPTSIKLSWTEAPYADGTVAGYIVYRNGTQISKIQSASTTTYTDTVASGSTNSYTVVAYDSSSPPYNSQPQANPVVITTGLTPPTNVKGSASSPNQIDLTWNASTLNGGPNLGLVGYNIVRKDPGGSTNTITTVGPTITQYSDKTVSPGSSYTYTIVSIDNNNPPDQASSTPVVVSTPSLPNPPQAPTNAKAVVNAYNSIGLSWTASVDTNGTVGGYYILRSTGSGSPQTIASVTSTNYTDNSVSPLTTYTYKIEAFDSKYTGVVSTAASTTPASVTTPNTPDTQPPTQPTLSATAASSSQINLTFKATDNIGVVKYEVYRNGNLQATVTGANTTYGDSGLSPSTTYTYYVIAYDAAGNKSTPSSTVSAKTLPTSNTVEVWGYITDISSHAALTGASVYTGIHGTASGAATSTTDSSGKYDLTQITPVHKHDYRFTHINYYNVHKFLGFPAGIVRLDESLKHR
ncbi:MAG: fibronectin type III domain-containing protein [Candidatus Saccharimonadales bacterium]